MGRRESLVRRGEDLQPANLTEAELGADRRGCTAVALNDRRGTAVGAGVGEPPRDERAIEAVAAIFLERRGTAQQDGGRVGQIDEPGPRDDRVVIERGYVRARL